MFSFQIKRAVIGIVQAPQSLQLQQPPPMLPNLTQNLLPSTTPRLGGASESSSGIQLSSSMVDDQRQQRYQLKHQQSVDETPRPTIVIPPPSIELDELYGEPDCAFDDISSRISGLEEVCSLDNFGGFGPEFSASSGKLSDEKTSQWIGSDVKEEENLQGQQEEEYSADLLSYYQQEHDQLTAILAADAVAKQGVGEHQLSGIGSFVNPALSIFENAVAKFTKEQQNSNCTLANSPPPEASKLLTLVEELLGASGDSAQAREGMVKTLEQASRILHTGLAYWHVFSEETCNDLLDSLCEWAITAADYQKTVKTVESSPILKVRGLKAGLYLLCQLVTLSPEYSKRVLSDGRIQLNLIELLVRDNSANENNEQIPILTSPVENLIVKTLFYSCCSYYGATSFVENCYAKFLMWLVAEKNGHGKSCPKRRCFDSIDLVLNSVATLEIGKTWESFIGEFLEAVEKNVSNEDLEGHLVKVCDVMEWLTSQWKLVSTKIKRKETDYHARLVHLSRSMKNMKIIKVILALISEPTLQVFTREMRLKMTNTAAHFLEEISSTKAGLLFLLCDGSTTTELIKTLVLMSGKLQQTGIDLSYRLLMIQLFDQLAASVENKTKNNGHHFVLLRTLAGLVGRQHCVHLLAGALSSDMHHIEMLLKIAEDDFPKISLQVELVFTLLLALIHHLPSDETFKDPTIGLRLISLCNNYGPDFTLGVQLKNLMPFLEEKDENSVEEAYTLTKLCTLLKQLSRPLPMNPPQVFSASLQTILRLVWFSVSENSNMEAIDRKINLAAVWKANIFPDLLEILLACGKMRLYCVQRNCYPPLPQQQLLCGLVVHSFSIITAMLEELGTTSVVSFDVNEVINAILICHSAFCSIPLTSFADTRNVHVKIVKCFQTVALFPARMTVTSKPPFQISFIESYVDKFLSSPCYHLSGLILLSDSLTPDDVLDEENRTHISNLRNLFTASFFSTKCGHLSKDFQRIITSLYLTDSPPLQYAFFRFLRVIAHSSQSATVNVLKVTLSLVLDVLAKVATSLRNVIDSLSKSSPEAKTVDNFVSSPFYAACKALALVTHLMLTSPATHATFISEISSPSSDRQFQQIVGDLATLVAVTCRRLSMLSPLSADEFLLHSLDFFTQILSPNFTNKGGISRFIPLSVLTLICEAALRCLVGPKSTLTSSNQNLNDDLGIVSDDRLSPMSVASTIRSDVQQSAWRLLALLAEERNGAAIWNVTDTHPATLQQAVMTVVEPIAAGSIQLDEDSIATLTEMTMALHSLASRCGCGQKVGGLICHGLGEAPNPLEQLRQQLTMMELISSNENEASQDDGNENEAIAKMVDASGLAERLQKLLDLMSRPNSSADNESVPRSDTITIHKILELAFKEISFDPFTEDSNEEVGFVNVSFSRIALLSTKC